MRRQAIDSNAMDAPSRSSWIRPVAVAGVFLAAMAVGLAVVRPFAFGPIGPDAAAPVIAFERLVAGRQLEGFLSQTSKPLLTLVYGLARSATGDWRSVSLLAITSYALFVALAAVLADRLGGWVAGAFVGVALLLAPELLKDVTFAYGVSWALLAAVLAGLSVTGARPRYAVAGTCLAVGALARPEILAVTAVTLVFVAAGHVVARLTHGTWGSRPPARAWLVGIGLVAIPVFALHDWALLGDPMFWANTAQANSQVAGKVRSLPAMILFVGNHVLAEAPLLPFAALGVADAIVGRRWRAAVVIAIVPTAVAAFYIASGARGTVISARYLMPIDLALLFAAGVGLGALAIPRLREAFERSRVVQRQPLLVPAAALVTGAAIAVALAPIWPTARVVAQEVEEQRTKVEHANEAIGVLRGLIPANLDWRSSTADDRRTEVLIPPSLRAQAIVDLDLPLWAGTKASPELLSSLNDAPAGGVIVYRDRLDKMRSPGWAAIEVDKETIADGMRVTPLYVDEQAGIWVVRVRPAAGP
jgi:hypothetical protein